MVFCRLKGLPNLPFDVPDRGSQALTSITVSCFALLAPSVAQSHDRENKNDRMAGECHSPATRSVGHQKSDQKAKDDPRAQAHQAGQETSRQGHGNGIFGQMPGIIHLPRYTELWMRPRTGHRT